MTTEDLKKKVLEEFDEAFGVYWGRQGGTTYRVFPDTGERPVVLSQEAVRAFLSQALSQIESATEERTRGETRKDTQRVLNRLEDKVRELKRRSDSSTYLYGQGESNAYKEVLSLLTPPPANESSEKP